MGTSSISYRAGSRFRLVTVDTAVSTLSPLGRRRVRGSEAEGFASPRRGGRSRAAHSPPPRARTRAAASVMSPPRARYAVVLAVACLVLAVAPSAAASDAPPRDASAPARSPFSTRDETPTPTPRPRDPRYPLTGLTGSDRATNVNDAGCVGNADDCDDDDGAVARGRSDLRGDNAEEARGEGRGRDDDARRIRERAATYATVIVGAPLTAALAVRLAFSCGRRRRERREKTEDAARTRAKGDAADEESGASSPMSADVKRPDRAV